MGERVVPAPARQSNLVYGTLALVQRKTKRKFLTRNSLDLTPRVQTFKCLGRTVGVRSTIEHAQQKLLQRGHKVGAVLADFTKYGYLVDTVHRMNLANLRRFRNVREPNVCDESTTN